MDTTTVTRNGLGSWLLRYWPEEMRPHGLICDGDTLIVPVWDGSQPISLHLLLDDHLTTFCSVEDGDLFTRIMRLYRTDDLDWLIDRYGVTVQREQDDAPATIYVEAQSGIVWRVIRLIGFVQAVLDYSTGLEVQADVIARLEKLVARVA